MKTPSLTHSVLAAIAGIMLLTFVMGANKGPKGTETEVFMRTKLIYSQGILEGLALERFDMVSKNALKLRGMAQSNMWFSSRQPDYMVKTTNYYRCVDALYLSAVDRNLDAATEAYVNVARSCVDCHRLVRLEQHRKQFQTTSR